MIDDVQGSGRCSQTTVFDNQLHVKRPFWNVSEVAVFLKISERTVRDLVYKHKIPYRKVGRCVRFSSGEIERWTLPHKEE